MADEENVIALGIRPQKLDPDRTIERVPYSICQHPRFLVDETLAEVECAVCHERLNPIWVLRQIADSESQVAQRRNKLRALVKQLADRTRYRCRSCGEMNDMSRIVKVRPDFGRRE